MTLPFDPRAVPLVHLPPLPAVSPDVLRVHALKARFEAPPVWQPDALVERWIKPGEPVAASVLVPLVVRAGQAGQPFAHSVLLTQRNAGLRNHAGQISFPGGRQDPQDLDEVATALREAQEEVGLAPSRVEIIGRMPVYETGTGFRITPIVGLIHVDPEEQADLGLVADPAEVEEVFEVPLAFLMDPANHRRHELQLGPQALSYFSMPWQAPHRDEDYFIWGATAAMLRNFYRFLAA
jgi:8-oxo-dGTP pyrophosphatase MutT (NUDIX family)